MAGRQKSVAEGKNQAKVEPDGEQGAGRGKRKVNHEGAGPAGNVVKRIRSHRPKVVREGAARRPYKWRDLPDRVYASPEARQGAIDRAEKLQSELNHEFPSFIKPMTQSHVTGGFWLSLPCKFCKDNLPEQDALITLFDENLDAFRALFLADKNGLSGGWRGFAIDHGLVDGDALVFHLINPTAFKVYILRANGSSACSTKRDNKRSKSGKAAEEKLGRRLTEPSSSKQQFFETKHSSSSSEPSLLSEDATEEEDSSGDLGQKPNAGKEPNNTPPPAVCLQCFRYKEGMRRKTLEAESAVKENEELRFNKSCKVCMDCDASALLLPCKHLCVCKSCEPKLNICPLCNTGKVSSVEVFMS